MRHYTLAFRDKAELREIWSKGLSSGFFFLPSEEPFPLQDEFLLVLKIHQTHTGLVLRARVVQHLEGQSPKGKGMVAEFLYFNEHRDSIQALVDNLDNEAWKEVRDFSKPRTAKPVQAVDRKKAQELGREAKTILKSFSEHDLYGVLKLDRAASKKEIKEAYFKLAETLHPDRHHDQAGAEELRVLEEALQRVSEAYDVLKDPEKRQEYDFSCGMVVRRRDEDKKSYEKKLQAWALHKAGKSVQEVREKARRLFEEGLKALEKGDVHAGITNVKLAAAHDKNNRAYKKKLEELNAQYPEESKAVSQDKMEALLRGQERLRYRD